MSVPIVRFHWRDWLLAAGAVFILCAQVQSAETRRLRIGTSGDYAPFSEALAGTPAYTGFDIAVAEAFARDRDLAIEWVPFRWPELKSDFDAGRFDVVMSGITVRPGRSLAGRFSVPVMTSGAVLIYATDTFAPDPLTADLPAILSRFDLRGIRIGVNRGGHLEQVARMQFPSAEVIAIPDNTAVRDALAARDVDAVVTDSLEAPHWLRSLDGVAAAGPFTEDRKAYWWTADNVELAQELDTWLMARETDGTLARLRLAATGDASLPRSADPMPALLAAIDERFALMPLVGSSKRAAGIALEDKAQEIRVLDSSWRNVETAAHRMAVEGPAQSDVSAFYRALIECAKEIQRKTVSSAAAPAVVTVDLYDVLRPALARIDERMAGLVVALQGRGIPADLDAEIAQALNAHDLDQTSLMEIGSAIAAIARPDPAARLDRHR